MIRPELETTYHPMHRKQCVWVRVGQGVYQRIAGGMMWPSLQEPGFACIVAEDWQQDEAAQAYHLRVIEEHEDRKIHDLLTWCQRQELAFPDDAPLSWYADTTSRPHMEFVWALRRSMREQGRNLSLSILPAPYVDDRSEGALAFHVENIRRYRDRDILHFLPDSALPSALAASVDKPAVPAMALGYAVSALATWPRAGAFLQ